MKNKFNINKNFIKLLNLTIIILIIHNMGIINAKANNEANNQLIIDSPDEIYEETNFSISVYTILNNTPYYQINTQIFFNNNTYNITYNEPEIIIESPVVNKDTNFKIKAIKTGYISDEKYILVLNNIKENKSKLVITILDNDFIVEGNTYFSLLVTNEKGIPISNTTVGIQNFISKNSIDVTDENGRARLFAPNNCDEIIILAQKNGYLNTTEILWIDRNPNIIERIIQNPYTLILFSIIILITAITIVTKRKNKNEIHNKKNNYKKNNDIKSLKEKHTPTNKKNNHNINNFKTIKEAKVEEIRINKKDPSQKIINLNNEQIKNYKKNKKINQKDNCFQGMDEIRYKIDKLTGNIDNINENNWFEGKENLKNKIDEKLKKNKK